MLSVVLYCEIYNHLRRADDEKPQTDALSYVLPSAIEEQWNVFENTPKKHHRWVEMEEAFVCIWILDSD